MASLEEDVDEVETSVFSDAAHQRLGRGSTSSSARSPRYGAPCCRCVSRCVGSPPAPYPASTRTPRRSSATCSTTSRRSPRRSTVSTSCCRPPSTPTSPRSRCSRTRTCARSRPASALVVVPTLIAGVYGMNFDHMPELGWDLGYPFAIALMVRELVAALWILFKRSGWLVTGARSGRRRCTLVASSTISRRPSADAVGDEPRDRVVGDEPEQPGDGGVGDDERHDGADQGLARR